MLPAYIAEQTSKADKKTAIIARLLFIFTLEKLKLKCAEMQWDILCEDKSSSLLIAEKEPGRLGSSGFWSDIFVHQITAARKI